jgi:hypothetical protein
MANNIESVGFSQSSFHGRGGSTEREESREEVDDSDRDGDGDGDDGQGVCVGGESEAILIPRDSPSKSWWNMIAVTSDTG